MQCFMFLVSRLSLYEGPSLQDLNNINMGFTSLYDIPFGRFLSARLLNDINKNEGELSVQN